MKRKERAIGVQPTHDTSTNIINPKPAKERRSNNLNRKTEVQIIPYQ